MANNSVQRLYDFIVDVRNQPDTTVANAMAKIFGIKYSADTFPLFYQRISVVYSQISFSYENVKQIPGDKSEYIEPINAISRAIFNLQENSPVRNSPLGQIPDATITALRFTARRVTDLNLEKEISDEDVEKLLKGVNGTVHASGRFLTGGFPFRHSVFFLVA